MEESANPALPRGTRVGVSWIGGTDGECAYCRRGLENLCDAPTFTGYTADGGYAVSVRAPQATVRGAAELAREFGGGGRAAAAGIDRLPEAELPRFIARLAAARWSS